MKYTKEIINEKFIQKGKPNIIALSECNCMKDRVDLFCTIHNKKFNRILDSSLGKKYSCPDCANESRIHNITKKYNLFIDAPDTAKLLEDPNDSVGLSPTSKKKRWFVCPICKNRLYKSIVEVTKYGLSCEICSDGFSYPNKLMFNILSSLDLDFIAEYSPSWISPKRYDFKYNTTIIEMDGGLGHGNKVYGNNKTIQETIETDKYKDEKAEEHGFTVIRIDCKKSDIEYIKRNILNSGLSKILDLSKIDWKLCDFKSHKSILKDVCEYYNKHSFSSIKDIQKIYPLHKSTILKYLKKGYENELNPKYKKSYGKNIICMDSEIIFSSASECSNFYNISIRSILKCCNGKQKYAGGLIFKYLKDVDVDIDKLIPNYKIKITNFDNKRSVNLYDKDFNFIKAYESEAEAVKDTGKSLRQIIKSCNSVHKFNYGMTFYYADDVTQPDKTKIFSI